MSSFVDDEKNLLTVCVLRTYTLNLPIAVENTDWKAILLSSNLPSEAVELVEKLYNGRKAMIHELNHDGFGGTDIDVYLSSLTCLLESLNCQATVKVNTRLLFTWCGLFEKKNNSSISSAAVAATSVRHAYEPIGEIIYEIVMCLWSKVLMLYRQGISLLQTIPQNSDNITLAAKSFIGATSVCDYLSEKTLPRWLNGGRLANKILEASPLFATAIRHLCMACSNQCVVAKSILNKSSSKALMKLCSAVAHNATESLEYFGKIKDWERVDDSLLTHVSFLKKFFTALSFYHSGVVAEKGALAIASYGAVVTSLTQQGKPTDAADVKYNPFNSGLPKLSFGPYAECYRPLSILLGDVNEKHETADMENNSIYHETVINELKLPEPVFIMKVTPFTIQSGGIVYFQELPNVMPPSTESEPVKITDEEYARQLQAQINN